MTQNTQANSLEAELDKTIKENKEFLADIDRKIVQVDLEYAQALIEEEKGFLKIAKKSLEEEKN